MKVMAISAGALLVALAVMGAGQWGRMGAATTFALAPANGAVVSGTATVTGDDQGHTFITVHATNMNGPASYGLALMSSGCTAVVALLNPIEADVAGDGVSTAQTTQSSDAIWLGILTKNDVSAALLACGGTGSSDNLPTPTDAPAAPPGGTVVPVATPTRFPTPLPGVTATPLGS